MSKKLITLICAILMLSQCRVRNSDLSAEYPEIKSMGDWLRAQAGYIEVLKAHDVTVSALLKEIERRQKLQPSLGLAGEVSNGNYGVGMSPGEVAQRAAELQAQGEAIDNYNKQLQGQAMYASELAKIQQMQEQAALLRNKQAFENASMAANTAGQNIKNIGTAIENDGKILDNNLKALDIVLKNMYAMAYARYQKAYANYTKQIENVWNKIGKVTGEASSAQKELRKFKMMSNTCEARRRAVWSLKNTVANKELLKKVSLGTLPSIIGNFMSTPLGEACLDKALLRKFDAEELGALVYLLAVPIDCPKKTSENETLNPDLYPAYVVKDNSFYGFLRPVTYYQTFKLLSNYDYPVTVAQPEAATRSNNCSPKYNTQVAGYLEMSKELESGLAATIEVSVKKAPKSFGYSADLSTLQRKSAAHVQFLKVAAGIFSAAADCVETQKKIENAKEDEAEKPDADPATPASASNRPAFSTNIIFDDKEFPEMSTSVRECTQIAEQHIYRIMAQLDAATKSSEFLEKLNKMAPPRSPHPVQFSAINQPGVLPGNN